MSLQVWLPLNGNLNNQGLSNYNLVMFRGSEVYNNNGKIGKCFYANGVNTIKILNIIPNFYNYTGYSLCAWFYIEGQNPSHSGSAIISAGNWNNQVLNLSVSDWSSDHYTRLRISGTNWNNTYTYNFQKNIWYHVVVSSDGNKTYAYVNGVLLGDTASGFLPTNIEGTDMCIGGATYYSGMQFFGRINDVRIYDHCLSQKEVEEIAKGLILHYKLDNNGLGNPNLFKGTIMRPIDRTSFVSNSSKDWTKYLRYYNGNTSIHTFAEEDGIYIDTVKLNSAANLGICFGRLASEINLDSSSYYTISCEAKCTKAGAGLDIGLSYLTTSDSWVWRGGSNRKLFNNTTDWQFFTHTFKPDSDTKAIDYCFTVLGVSNGTDTLSIRKCKLEKGSVATSWFPAPEDMGINENIIYDSSGYNHNGTFSNNSTIKIISDPPKYSYGIHLSKTKINCTTGFPAGDNPDFTVVFWARIFSNITYVSYGDLTGMYDTGQGSNTFRLELCGSPASNNIMWFRGPSGQSSGGFNMNTSSNNGWFSKDTWHQIALTGNGQTKQYICYLDGVQCGTYNGSANSWSPTGQFYIGDTIEATADFSDYRIYSTVLSPEAIKELYNTSATIDNNGNIYSRELVES